MATDEIKIDLDAIDADEGKKTKKNGAAEKKDAAAADTQVIKVEKTDTLVLRPEDGLAKLQKQLDDERSARESAERDAHEARQNEVNARAQSQGDQLALVTTALESVKTSQKALKADYAAALAAQDFERVAEIQELMSDNSARIIQLDAGKKQLEKAPKPTARPPTDPVEQFVSTMTPQSASWVRAHAEYVRDPKLNRKMIRAHEDAMDDGIKVDSPEYFASIEKNLGLTKEAIISTEDVKLDDPVSAAAAATSRRTPPPSAPVSRGGSGTGSRPNVVTLSADEVEMARATGLTPEEYARNKMALKRDGRLQ
jgi:hypothetical protein